MQIDHGAVIAGAVFGLSAGLTPGPLLTLVVSETLRHGGGAGVRVAMAPLITDAPIIAVTLLVVARLSEVEPVLGAISLLGGGYLCYLGYESVAFHGLAVEDGLGRPRSMRKGIIANFLNPSPYLFWFSIGAPTVIKALGSGWAGAVLFVLLLYVFLVGAKVVLALAIGRYRQALSSKHYILTIRILGVALFVFAAVFIRDGLRYLGLGFG